MSITQNFPFTTPSNYTYDTDLIEVTGGVAKLKNLAPTDMTAYASYNSTRDLTQANGSVTGTPAAAAMSVRFSLTNSESESSLTPSPSTTGSMASACTMSICQDESVPPNRRPHHDLSLVRSFSGTTPFVVSSVTLIAPRSKKLLANWSTLYRTPAADNAAIAALLIFANESFEDTRLARSIDTSVVRDEPEGTDAFYVRAIIPRNPGGIEEYLLELLFRGYQVSMESPESAERGLYCVLIGEFPSRQEAASFAEDLREKEGWSPDLDELNEMVSKNTKLIAVCNPNNPTGYILTESEINSIVDIAEGVNAWILADEVYSGAERLTDKQTPSFYGKYDKIVAVGSMSKAYGLPGLRIGWVVAPVDTIDDIWARHEYNTICATMLSNKLAAIALSSKVRPRIIKRTRNYIRKGYPILQKWMDSHENTFCLTPPQAAAIAFVRYHLNINSSEFIERLRKEKSVLIVPGDHFGMDKFVRISFGLPEDYLTRALDRTHDLIMELKSDKE